MGKIISALASVLMLQAAHAEILDRRILIINKSNEAIIGLYASPINEAKWKYNMMQGDAIAIGESRVADTNDGSGFCRMDLLVVGANGSRAIRRNANICELETWTIY